VPLYQFTFGADSVEITTRSEISADMVWQEIMNMEYDIELENGAAATAIIEKIGLTPRISKADYLQNIHTIKEDIVSGDYYEINFCQELYCTKKIVPLSTFFKLNALTQSPFACYYKYEKKYLMGASPERFLRKQGRNLTSNPIKGTAARGKNKEEDAQIKAALQQSEKDRAENVMIVDLVRNDFARCCEIGTVQVPELCAIYTYPQVHQMISTVTGQLPETQSFAAALQVTFPMGSMTGAPKIMAMQRIERYEKTRRGWYSGAVGYITPEGDFDFNVVIRSIFYNAETDYLSTQVGGAIVYDSTAESEYAECLLKAKGVLAALNAEILE
jgi:para-aminobenzoate synthetase component 1